MSESSPVKFYGADAGKPYAMFSNMFIAPFEMPCHVIGDKKNEGEQEDKKRTFQSVECCFQALKFAPTSAAAFEEVRKAATPKLARKLGKAKSRPLRKDWETAKEGVMLQAVRCKFQQNENCAEKLLSTGERELQEASPFDYCWGIGKTGSGNNLLGKILMKVRGELRESTNSKAKAKKAQQPTMTATKKK